MQSRLLRGEDKKTGYYYSGLIALLPLRDDDIIELSRHGMGAIVDVSVKSFCYSGVMISGGQ